MPPATMKASPAHVALHSSPIPALRRLSLVEEDDMVTIDGTVHSYYFKQLAQETVMPLLGGRRLQNRVVVVTFTPVPNHS